MALAKALFTNGSASVACATTSTYPTYWTKQLRVGDFIRPLDAQNDYTVLAIIDDSNMTLDSTYSGTTGAKPFSMTSKYPLFDDDGYTGPKITGTKSDGYGIIAYDYLSVTVDSSDQTCAFDTNTNSGLYIAQMLTSNLNGVAGSYEWVVDPTASYGYRETLVLRTDGTHNKLIIHSDASGTAEKLGFIPDTTVWGNNNNTDSSSEYRSLVFESYCLNQEISALANVLATANKLDRSTSDALMVYNSCLNEIVQTRNEAKKLEDQSNALGILVAETTLPSYADSLVSFNDATQALSDSSSAFAADNAVKTAMDAKPYIDSLLDIQSGIQDIDPVSDTTFVVSVDPSYDRRFLNDPYGIVDGNIYEISTVFQDSGKTVYVTYFPWVGAAPTYSVSGDLTATVVNSPNFLILKSLDSNTYGYTVSRTGLVVDHISFSYVSHSTIGSMKTAINGTIPYIDATGLDGYDAQGSGFVTGSGTFGALADATLQRGLRACTVGYYTIDDVFVSDRSSWDVARLSVIGDRTSFIDIRELQIRNAILSEEYLRAPDGSTGNLYNWADNRFNRSAGCEARLKQIEKQMEMNQSSLDVNRRFT